MQTNTSFSGKSDKYWVKMSDHNIRYKYIKIPVFEIIYMCIWPPESCWDVAEAFFESLPSPWSLHEVPAICKDLWKERNKVYLFLQNIYIVLNITGNCLCNWLYWRKAIYFVAVKLSTKVAINLAAEAAIAKFKHLNEIEEEIREHGHKVCFLRARLSFNVWYNKTFLRN